MARLPLSEQIAAAAREMEGEHDPQETMAKAVQLGVQLVPDAQEASISLVTNGGRVETPATTSEVVRRLDALQHESEEGPCLDAVREQEVVTSADVGQDDRWLRWGPAAVAETGVRSMLCFRLFTQEDRLGALNLYSRQRDAFDDEDREHGLALAAHVSIAMAAAQAIDQLKAGMDTRTVIGQATGIVMERFDIGADRAFAVLTRISSHTNRKLRDIAHEVVVTGKLPKDPKR